MIESNLSDKRTADGAVTERATAPVVVCGEVDLRGAGVGRDMLLSLVLALGVGMGFFAAAFVGGAEDGRVRNGEGNLANGER